MTQIFNAHDTVLFWGVLHKEELISLNQYISKVGFEKAIGNHNFTSRFDYALDPHRANSIKFLFPDKIPYTVLEIGCGYGSLTVELSKKFDHVDAIDAVNQSLIFTEHRLNFEKCLNVKLHQTGVFEDKNFLSSFENDKYDLIIVNGVLEWVGSGLSEGDPVRFQKQFLAECNRKLKLNGLMYLAIENRFYPGWIRRDPHSKLPLTAIAPRSLANLISLIMTRNPYRTYIHGFRSLSKIMRISGFILNTKFYVYHSYRRPTVLFHDNHDFVKELLKEISPKFFTAKWKFFLKFAIKLNLIDLLIPTFTHVYGKQSKANLDFKYKFAFIKNSSLILKTWKK